MLKKISGLLAIIFFIMILVACTGSIAEEQDKAVEHAKEAFTSSQINPNNTVNNLSLYLPASMNVESSEETNILLSDGTKRYILFVNPIEQMDSKVLYESTQKAIGDTDIDESFEEDGKFGYIFISTISEEVLEVTVGIGGIKMTTETDVKDLSHEAGLMMEIISSIEYSDVENQADSE